MKELNLVTKASFTFLSLTFSLYVFHLISLSCSKYLPFYWTNNTAKLIPNKIFAWNLFKCILINIDRLCCFCVWMIQSILSRVDLYVDWYLRASIDIPLFALLKMHLIIIGNNILIGFVNSPTIQPHHNLTHIKLWYCQRGYSLYCLSSKQTITQIFFILFETFLSFLIWTALYNSFGCNRVRFETFHVYVSFSPNLENVIYQL